MVYVRLILYAVFLLIFTVFSIFWALVFLRRIYCCRKYKRSAVRCFSDGESGYLNLELFYHFETESRKYTLLLIISFCECLSSTIILYTYMIEYCAFNYKLPNNNTNDIPYNKCLSFNSSAVKQVSINYMINPYFNGFNSVGRLIELFVVVFVVCLMNYLIIRIKKIKPSYNRFNSRVFLVITILLSVIIIITGFIQLTTILSIVMFHISTIIYFCIFTHTSKQFKRALLQRALERLTQFGSNKEEMKQYNYFRITILIICGGFGLIIVSEILLQIPPIINSSLFFGKCYFPFILLPSFENVLHSERSVTNILSVLELIETTGRTLCFIAVVLTVSPFMLLTIAFVVNKTLKCFKGSKKIKYTTVNTSMESPLLSIN